MPKPTLLCLTVVAAHLLCGAGHADAAPWRVDWTSDRFAPSSLGPNGWIGGWLNGQAAVHRDGQTTALTSGPQTSWVYEVNGSGQSVGWDGSNFFFADVQGVQHRHSRSSVTGFNSLNARGDWLGGYWPQVGQPWQAVLVQGDQVLALRPPGTPTRADVEAWTLNDHGMVGGNVRGGRDLARFGFTYFDGSYRTFDLGGHNTRVDFVNNLGQAAGNGINAQGVWQGFVVAPDGQMSVLGLGGASSVSALRQDGLVVGTAWDGSASACMLHGGGQARTFRPQGADQCSLSAWNARGEWAGVATFGGTSRPFLRDSQDGLTLIDVAGTDMSVGLGGQGQLYGNYLAGEHLHGFLFEAGQTHDLGPDTSVHGVNDQGVAWVSVYAPDYLSETYWLVHDGQWTQIAPLLQALGLEEYSLGLLALDDGRWIGTGWNPDRQALEGFVLSAAPPPAGVVPLPPTTALAALGLPWAIWRAKRRARGCCTPISPMSSALHRGRPFQLV